MVLMKKGLIVKVCYHKPVRSFTEFYDSIVDSGFDPTIKTKYSILKRYSMRVRPWKIVASIAMIGLLLGVFSTINFEGREKPPHRGNAIQSDLALPSESVFLNRSELIQEIEHNLSGRDIQTVALVGMGGSCKTTLARQYARALAKTDEGKMILRGFQEIKNPNEKEEKIIQFVKERHAFLETRVHDPRFLGIRFQTDPDT
jgi:hypothetical protein